ncbi:hypothetical protein GCM10011609_49100 [Lentzea pudingi]|uniref:Uncharacterized protein n=1 Tax=Lentzea pudingi TaxID=1789439 RepID=A0ABQ2IBL8_9PSEU|nr:hypothetical protein [Lentzea pudingi]GGN04085.1 hypothetical protein GCM10011609_49100 [Lentzea pudingi]
MSKFFSSVVEFDTASADELVWASWRRAGFVVEHAKFGEQIDTKAVGNRLAEIFKTRHVIKDRKQLKSDPDRAAWREDIVEEFFGDEPLLYSASSPEEEAARDQLVKMVWEYASTSLSSPLNVALAELHGYVLLQAKVAKRRARPGMKGVPVPSEARFLTEDFELIRDYGITRGLESWRRATERFEALLKEFGNRQPELRLAIAKTVAKEMPSVTGVLVHADPKAITAEHGTGEGKAED